MKKIEAVIRPLRAEDVRLALEKAGCHGMMMTELRGHGQQGGIVRQLHGAQYRMPLVPKVRLELIVKESDVERITGIILEAARTGEIGDGKIFVLPVDEAIKIRTGEKGENVI